MPTLASNPVHFRVDTLLALDLEQVHELACAAVGTVTSYRLVLGRCLLAMRESKGFRRFGCSSEIHYAVAKLGVSKRIAGSCRLVADRLRYLPELTLAAETGKIDWCNLREITRKATVETEAFWLKLCDKMNYDQIESLIRKTPLGAIPGDVFQEEERSVSELRCVVSEGILAMVERARRMYSLEQDKAVSTAEVLEFALASYIANQPLDEEVLEKVREDMDKDLQAEKARKVPLVAQARGVARRMGLIPVHQVEVSAASAEPKSATDGSESHTPEKANKTTRTGQFSPVAKAATPSSDESNTHGSSQTPFSSKASPLVYNEIMEQALGKPSEAFEGKGSLQTKRPLHSKKLAFNPHNRLATRAQRREILRRDGWCCSTPGCPHKIWLHIHHLIPYAKGGLTNATNLLGLCVACHTNLHKGHLAIRQLPDGSLLFTDPQGESIGKQADLELAGWLDFWQGWRGREQDSHKGRATSGAWKVYDRPLRTG